MPRHPNLRVGRVPWQEGGRISLASETPDLQAIYRTLYDTLPWPEPIPHPAQVIFRWGRYVRGKLGSCSRTARSIAISPLYEDQRLRGELDHLMAHEASHFIWRGHPKVFKDFLRSAGIATRYINGRIRVSETFKVVETDWLARQPFASPLSLRFHRRRRPLMQIELPVGD